jgi:molybdopterin-guanine dinucleotide biosynthesis protein A
MAHPAKQPTAQEVRRAPFTGVVLAAGLSTRMGRDKALLEWEGRPMWERQRDVLRQAGADEVFLSARPEQAWTRQARGFDAVVHDATPSCGPISGITAAIERASHSHVAVLAIDLPRMPVTWFEALISRCPVGAGMAGCRGKYFEPLAAVYPRELMALAREALVAKQFSLQALLWRAVDERFMQVHEITAAEAGWFENWNEPG